MTASRAGQLHIGDFVRFDSMLHEVVGLDGAVAILLSDAGRRVVLKIGALLGDPTFEIIDSRRRRRPLAPAYFESLPAEVRDRALWLESHVSEVLDGIRVGGPDAAPRPEYDVTRTTLRQRELAKVEELAATDRPIGLRVLQRYRRDYAIKGVEALIDKRVVRQSTLTGRVDERYVEAFRRVLADNTHASTGTSARLKRMVDKAVEAEHGPDVVRIPSRQTFDRLRARMREARHATGSARQDLLDEWIVVSFTDC